MKNLLFILLFIPWFSNGQSFSLGKDRIDKIKKSVVRISINGTGETGTGFVFLTLKNRILVITCWHVIKSSIGVYNSSPANEDREIYAEFSDGEKIKLRVASLLLGELYEQAVSIHKR